MIRPNLKAFTTYFLELPKGQAKAAVGGYFASIFNLINMLLLIRVYWSEKIFLELVSEFIRNTGVLTIFTLKCHNRSYNRKHLKDIRLNDKKIIAIESDVKKKQLTT